MTRTVASIDAALPSDRRAFLGSSLALASVVAASAVPAVADVEHPDAELLALRDPYERTLAELDAVCDWHTPFEDAYFAQRREHPSVSDEEAARLTGFDKADAAQGAASSANMRVIEQIAATPARTLVGVRFKAEISKREFHSNPDLLESIANEVVDV